MGCIINIDEALKLRTDYNVLREPLNNMLQNQQEAWERENPIDLIFNRGSISTFQETYTSSIGFNHAFAETSDYSIGPIFNTAEGFSATYTTRTFQGGFIITQQALEDRQLGKVKDDASAFMKRWHGDIVEYCMKSISGGFGNEVTWGDSSNGGISRIKLNSADTSDGDVTNTTKNPLFCKSHKTVKRSQSDTAISQSNIFYADVDLTGNDSGKIAKLADVINQVITIMENYKDDNGKYAGVMGAKTIVCANEPHLKAAIETALAMDQFKQGESMFLNPAYKRATLKTTPYLNAIPQCFDSVNNKGVGFFIVDKSYNAENHGPELTERVALTLDVNETKRPKGITYDGRQRFDVNVASWRGISYVYIGTPNGSSGEWDYSSNFTQITPTDTIVTPVSVVTTSSTPMYTTPVNTSTTPVFTKTVSA